jgi:putative ABC transport system permease protein
VTLFLVGQSISRQARDESGDYATLRSLGATRAELTGIVLLRGALVGAGGAALAFTAAVLCSPLMPLGLARQAEVHPGFEINVAILVPGCLILGLLVVARSAIPAWRTSRRAPASVDDSSATRPSRLAGILAGASAPAAAVVGVRFGLESGRGRTAVPVISAMVTGAAAVATLAAAMTFGTSLAHLVNTPRQQGWNWDVLVGNPNDVNDREVATGRLLGRNRLIGSFSATANLGAVIIQGVSVPTVLAIDPLKGSVYPPLLEGRAPRAPDEIVLGTRTLQQLHRRVGQTVRVSTPGGAATMRVVGRMVVPSVGDVLTNSLGEGGWVSGSLVHRQWASPTNPSGQPPTGTDVFNIFAVRYAPGASPAAAFASLQRQFGRTVLRQLPAEDAVNLQSVDTLPFVLAGLVALLGVATVGNTVIVSVRRRRRDLAILKTIGFVRRQVSAAVAWQATSFGVVALVIGMPLGVAGGRWAWSLVASGIDSASPALVPTLAVALVAPAALAVTNLVAAWPGWVAARVAPAVVMRAE